MALTLFCIDGCRFWHKVLYDLGLTKHKEPFQKLVHQGTIHLHQNTHTRMYTHSRMVTHLPRCMYGGFSAALFALCPPDPYPVLPLQA